MNKTVRRKRVNLRDVAVAANVSAATVSRVINAPHCVAEETRKRVEKAMKDLSWMPSAAARAINTGRTRFVGALVPTLDQDIFTRMLANLEARLAEHQLSMVVATTQHDPDLEAKKAKGLVNIGAEGLIISGTSHAPELYALIERSQLPTVATSSFDPNYFLPTIGYDNAHAARAALNHLTSLGHQHIAVVHGPLANNDRSRARVAGVRHVSDNVDLTLVERPISVAGGCSAARDIIAAPNGPSAILCFSDVLASGVLFELLRSGIRVPADLSVMGLDDLPASEHLFPELTTVHLPVAQMGLAAADAIAGWVENLKPPSARRLDFDLVIRSSTSNAASNGKQDEG